MTLNKDYRSRRHKPFQRSPDFDSGIIEEPFLAFGGQHEHVDPKIGLGLYGPYTLPDQTRPVLSSIIVGIVGPSPMIADAEQWIDVCKGMLTNDGSQPFLYPHFPGFNAHHPFQCELVFGDTWVESLKATELRTALDITNFYERVKEVVTLYIKGIEILAQRDPRPDVILCCIPQEVIDYCTVHANIAKEIKRVKVSKAERRAKRVVSSGQLFLFPEMDPTLGIEDMERGHQNLRRGLKAEAMQFGIPTQLVWPRTLQRISPTVTSGESKIQDVATRAWNFIVALYHKAGGSPWRLAHIEPGACFVGVSFYKEILESNPHMRTSMAQTFTAAGDGYVLRGNSFEWDGLDGGRSPHLDQKSAAALMQDVLDLYQRQNRGSIPSRIVVHKTSRFWEEELSGFMDACQYVPRKDFVALGWRGIQFYRTGDYPPIRGTYVKFSETDLLLYTAGYVPFLRTYPGARVPQPIEVIEHHGDSPWNVVLREILALTKMNWNTADFACSEPITIAFSQRVGQILAELPPDLSLRPEYRFYM
jgi:uncharacterized protein Usg